MPPEIVYKAVADWNNIPVPAARRLSQIDVEKTLSILRVQDQIEDDRTRS